MRILNNRGVCAAGKAACTHPNLSHPLGQCQVRPDLRMTRRFLSNTGMNPNIAEGGRAILAECTEWMGCEHWLTSRAKTPELAEQIVAAVKHLERRAMESGEDIRGSQPTGDNIAGGLPTIEEKSMGAVKKGGSSPVVGYLDIAERPGSDTPGLYVMYGPGHGGESISSMAAAGCQVLVFSTGGGIRRLIP